MSKQMSFRRLTRLIKIKHIGLVFISSLFFSFFIGAVTSTGNEVSMKVNSEQLEPSLGIEDKDALEQGEESTSYENVKSNEEGLSEEVDGTEEYSEFPTNFIIPKGTCDPGEPAIVFSE